LKESLVSKGLIETEIKERLRKEMLDKTEGVFVVSSERFE